MTQQHIDDEPQPGLPAFLDALEDLVTHARAMPMSASVLVNKADALDLIDQMREVMPTQLSHADEVLSDADRALADAQSEAEQIVASARSRAQQLVSSEQVVVQSEAKGREIVQGAEEEAARLRSESDDYCDRRLAEFEIDLGKVLAQVQAGRAKLAGRLGEPGAEE